MGHKVYISFKTEDIDYKIHIQSIPDLDYVNKSLDVAIDSDNEDYILRRIRDEYLAESTVTIHLIGSYGAEIRGPFEQRFIKRELQASLYDGSGNTKNGILGIVLPSALSSVYQGSAQCLHCGGTHQLVKINDSTTIREFSYNYYLPHGGCSWTEEQRYCVLASWDDFLSDPEAWIDFAYDKRRLPIASNTKVRP